MFGLVKSIYASAVMLIVYLGAWGVLYRIPCTPAQTIDMRISSSDRPYYVNICAGLASNPHGFPGHAYLGWPEKSPSENIELMETVGYCPKYAKDQIPSVFCYVPGVLVKSTGTAGNARNLDRLLVICSHDDYERTKAICKKWNPADFQCGKRDCVALVDTVASALKLRTPNRTNRFPQDYVRELKKLNCTAEVQNLMVPVNEPNQNVSSQ